MKRFETAEAGGGYERLTVMLTFCIKGGSRVWTCLACHRHRGFGNSSPGVCGV